MSRSTIGSHLSLGRPMMRAMTITYHTRKRSRLLAKARTLGADPYEVERLSNDELQLLIDRAHDRAPR